MAACVAQAMLVLSMSEEPLPHHQKTEGNLALEVLRAEQGPPEKPWGGKFDFHGRPGTLRAVQPGRNEFPVTKSVQAEARLSHSRNGE